MYSALLNLIPLALLASQASAFSKRQDASIPAACTDQCSQFSTLSTALTGNANITAADLAPFCTSDAVTSLQACFDCATANGVDASLVIYAASALENGCIAVGSPIAPFVVGGASISGDAGGASDGGSATDTGSAAPTSTPASNPASTTKPPAASSTKPTTSGAADATSSGTPSATTTPSAAGRVQVQAGSMGALVLAFAGLLIGGAL